MENRNNTLLLLFLTYILNITIADAQESVTFPDSVKHSLIQPETPFIPELQYEELLSQPELPPVVPDFAPVTFKYAKERYQPVFLTDQTPYHYGEYRVSGVIRSFSNGALIGYGSQENWIGVGTFNTAAIGYIHNFSDRLTINTYLEAGKISIPRNINNSLTLRSSVSYRITDRLSVTGFGNIGTTRFHPMQYYNFGGYVGIDITDRFGTDLGMNRYYDPFRAGWRNVPIVAPYIRINGSKFGFDFGGLIKQIYDNRSNSGYQKFDSKPDSKRSGPDSPVNRKSPKRPQPKNNRFRNF